jgi:hypothetical protein
MATIPTWRNIGSPSFNNGFSNSAIGGFSAAGDAFTRYGDFLGDRAEQRATSAAIQRALQTGTVGTGIDPRADISAIQAALQTEVQTEGLGLQNTGFDLQNQIDQFTADNQAEVFEDEREEAEARIATLGAQEEAARARRDESRSAQAVTDEAVKYSRNVQGLENAFQKWTGETATTYFNELQAEDPNNAERFAARHRAEARERAQRDLADMVSSGQALNQFNTTAAVLAGTQLGGAQLQIQEARQEIERQYQDRFEKEIEELRTGVETGVAEARNGRFDYVTVDENGQYTVAPEKQEMAKKDDVAFLWNNMYTNNNGQLRFSYDKLDDDVQKQLETIATRLPFNVVQGLVENSVRAGGGPNVVAKQLNESIRKTHKDLVTKYRTQAEANATEATQRALQDDARQSSFSGRLTDFVLPNWPGR